MVKPPRQCCFPYMIYCFHCVVRLMKGLLYSLLSIGALVSTMALAAPPNERGQQVEPWREHRERRLQQALENGDVTQAQAERARRQWEERRSSRIQRDPAPAHDQVRPIRQDLEMNSVQSWRNDRRF